jgi:hypothetical protein
MASMAEGEQQKMGWRERRKAAKRERAERTGDSPEKRVEREPGVPDVKDAASGAAIRGSVSAPPGIGGIGGGGI